MAFQSVPNCVEVTLNANVTGVPVVNRWFVDVGHDVTHSDLTGVFAVFDNWITDSLSPLQTTTVHYDTLVLKDVDHENGEELTFVPTTLAGGVASAQTPNNVAVCVSLRTDLSGRAYRGRSYVGGIAATMIADPTHLTTTHQALWVAAFEDLIDSLNTATYVLVVVSKILAGVLRLVAIVTEITSIVVDTKLDSQRRRTAN